MNLLSVLLHSTRRAGKDWSSKLHFRRGYKRSKNVRGIQFLKLKYFWSVLYTNIYAKISFKSMEEQTMYSLQERDHPAGFFYLNESYCWRLWHFFRRRNCTNLFTLLAGYCFGIDEVFKAYQQKQHLIWPDGFRNTYTWICIQLHTNSLSKLTRLIFRQQRVFILPFMSVCWFVTTHFFIPLISAVLLFLWRSFCRMFPLILIYSRLTYLRMLNQSVNITMPIRCK